jgi:hypothetical protein
MTDFQNSKQEDTGNHLYKIAEQHKKQFFLFSRKKNLQNETGFLQAWASDIIFRDCCRK